MSIELSQFHKIFYEESYESLEAMENCLLNMDFGNPDAESLNVIFRAAHSIKGSSGTFGFKSIADFTHVMETLLEQMRSGKKPVTAEGVDLLLRSVDCLRVMLGDLEQGNDTNTDNDRVAADIVSDFQKLIEGEPLSNASTSAKADDIKPEGNVALNNSLDEDLTDFLISFEPGIDILKTGNEPIKLFKELAELGGIQVKCNANQVPSFSQIIEDECYLSWEILISTTKTKEDILAVFEWIANESTIKIDTLGGLFATPEREQPKPALDAETISASSIDTLSEPVKKSREKGSIRVSIDKIDNLVNLVGELVITQSMLGQLGKEHDENYLTKLNEGLIQLENNTRELQQSVMSIRMMPISFVFNRFPRMVRDISRTMNKKVVVDIQGETTELDKTVMEKIGDPVVHLIRNSLDHGIENTTERLRKGKPEQGTIVLNAYHQGGNVVIEIKDDGAGLNRHKIRDKALSQGLIAENEYLSDAQIDELIFHPGFSTADEVSDLSGRGVGMDVVRQNIMDLNGTIDVISVPDRGCKFIVKLPLTLAILDAQLIRVGSQTFIIPLVSIIESIQVDAAMISRVAGGCDVYRLRDEYLPIVMLWDVFSITPDSCNPTEGILVVLESGKNKIALLVDELLVQQQVVIKSVEKNYDKTRGVSGASILGNGRVSLIIDIVDLIDMAGVSHATQLRNRMPTTDMGAAS